MKAAGSVAWRCLVAIAAAAGNGVSNAELALTKAVGCSESKNVAVATGALAKKQLIERRPEDDGGGMLNFITEAGTAAIAAGAIPRAGAGTAPSAAKKPKKAKPAKPAKKKASKKTHRAARPAPASEPSGARFWLSDEVGLRIEADGCTGELSPAATQRLAEFVFHHWDKEAAA